MGAEQRADLADAPGALSPEERDARADLAAALAPHLFPADRQTLLDAVDVESGPSWMRALLDRLPDGRFETVQQVWDAAGGHRESGHA